MTDLESSGGVAYSDSMINYSSDKQRITERSGDAGPPVTYSVSSSVSVESDNSPNIFSSPSPASLLPVENNVRHHT